MKDPHRDVNAAYREDTRSIQLPPLRFSADGPRAGAAPPVKAGRAAASVSLKEDDGPSHAAMAVTGTGFPPGI